MVALKGGARGVKFFRWIYLNVISTLVICINKNSLLISKAYCDVCSRSFKDKMENRDKV